MMPNNQESAGQLSAVSSPQPLLRINSCPLCNKYYSPCSFLNHHLRCHKVTVIEPNGKGFRCIGVDLNDWHSHETRCIGMMAYVGRTGMGKLDNQELQDSYEYLTKCPAIICTARLEERPVSLSTYEHNKVFFMTIGLIAAPITDLLVLDIRVLEMEKKSNKIDEIDLFSKAQTNSKKKLHFEIQSKNFMALNHEEFWTGGLGSENKILVEVAIRTQKLEPGNGTTNEAQCSTVAAKNGKGFGVADTETVTD